MRLEDEIEKNIKGMIAVTIKEKFNDLWVKEFLFTFIKYMVQPRVTYNVYYFFFKLI